MPYIPQDKREALKEAAPLSAGELNYVITKICRTYLDNRWNYSTINEIIGALECAKLEFYRRISSPYEDKKCNENGDVYK